MMPTVLPVWPQTPSRPVWRPESDFVPRRWLSNGHVMTVFAWAARRTFETLPNTEERLIQVASDSRVLVHAHWQPQRQSRPTLIGLHGLEGSSHVHYLRGLAAKAWGLGWNVVRVNQRNCGGTEHLTPSLYHSGLTADPAAVIRALATSEGLQDFAMTGYSLGGNLTMKLAAEVSGMPDVNLRAVVAVCPTIDLARCVDAIERRPNFIYQRNFVRSLKARMRRKAAAWPGAFDLSRLDRIRTIREFDDIYTAPHHGFGTAANYYRQASAIRVIDQIAIPALIIAAADDPCVPASQFSDPRVTANPFVQVHVASHGGHCGFVGAPRGYDGFWAEREALSFLSAVMPQSAAAPATCP
jgi:predicted alpha/beta-fold hydrolase